MRRDANRVEVLAEYGIHVGLVETERDESRPPNSPLKKGCCSPSPLAGEGRVRAFFNGLLKEGCS